MCNLLWKELRLAAHPTLFVFLFMGALLLIPAYPYCVVFFFGCLGPTLTFVYGREDAFVSHSGGPGGECGLLRLRPADLRPV